MNSSPPYSPTKSLSGITLRKSRAKSMINRSPAECPMVSFAVFRLFRSNMMQTVGSLSRASQAPLLGSPVWASVYTLCYNSLFFIAIFIAVSVCIITRITRHNISSADNSSIVRIFTAIFSG